MFKHLLVPYDGSEHALRALSHAKQLVLSLAEAPKLTVLHVNPDISINEPPVGVELDEQIAREGEEMLIPVREALAGLPAGSCSTIVRHGDPGKIICKSAEQEQADLIVMGTRGLGLVSELLIGSVSHYVIQHASCPVTIVK
ncbi:universal stress protein [Paenibacillus pinistramenti]|uniref:universal stress protein n=1 Tax=Paenibacillus pinistramenti TaxID=1768003 RepID=UPI001EF157CE|nr:universal stress protein [Paenibacillus pinistramenti]